MKFLTGVSLGIAVVLGSTLPAWADSAVNADLVGGQQLKGDITRLDGDQLAVTTPSGVSQYQVDPDVVSALKLSQGSSVVIDGRRLETGRITGLSRNGVKVALDNGSQRSFVLTREGRRFLALGDRVVITPLDFPSRCQKIYSADQYVLTARDISVQPEVFVAEAPAPQPEPPVVTAPPQPAPIVIPEPPVGGPEVPIEVAPVRALW